METGKESAPLPTGQSTGLQKSAHLANLDVVAFDAIVAFDAQERITFWNPAAEQMYGWTASEVLGKTATELLWPTIPPQDQKDRLSRLKQGKTLRGEHHSRRKNGSLFWVEYSACMIPAGDAEFSRYMAILRDVTERKRAEDELQFVSRLPAENPNPVMRLTPEGNLLYANNSCALMLDSWKQNGHKVPVQMQEHAAEAFASGQKMEIEMEHQGKILSFTVAPNVDAGYVNFYGSDITERKKAQEALRQSEERLRVTFDTSVVGFAALGLDTHFMQVNDAFCSITGYSREELLQMNCASVTHPNAMESTNKSVAKLIAGEIPSFILDKIYVRKDGTEVWVQNRVSLVRHVDGKPLHLIAICQDITERKRAEEALRDSEERFRALVRRATVGIAESDLEGRFTFVNPKFCEMLGYSESELVGKTVWELTYVDDVEENKRLFERLLLQGKPYDFEKRFVRRDGSALWTNVSVTANYDLTGKPKGGIGIIIDVTQRKLAEEWERLSTANLAAAAEANAKFRTFFDQGSYFAGVMTVDGTIVEANRLCLDFCGFTREDVIGKKFWDCGWWNPSPALMEMVREGTEEAAQGKLFRTESTYYLADGSNRYVDLIIAPVKDESGQVLFLAPTGTDITERKRSERSLVEYARQQEALYALADQLQRSNSLEDVFDAALEAILNALQCDRASILLFDDADKMRFVAWRGLSDAYRKATDGHSPWKPDEKYPEPICMNAIETAELTDSLKAVLRNEGIGSLAFIPLVTHGKLIGKFMAYYNAPHVFSESQVDLGLTIAHQLAFGIDRKRADEALRHRSAEFETLLNQAPLGVYLVDADFRLREVNPVAVPTFGNIPNLIGRDFAEVMYLLWRKEYADEVVRLFRHTLETGEPYQTSERIENRIDLGTTEHYEWRIDRIPLPDSRYGVVCYFRDISAQVLAREKIRESEERFRTLANTMPSIVWTSTPDGQITYANDQGFQYVGLAPGASPIQWPVDVLHPDDYERCIHEWVEALKTAPDEYVIEVRLRRHDGEYRWFQARGVPTRDEMGNVTAWYGIATDIDDRIQVESALRESEKQLAKLNETLEQRVREQTAEVRRLASDLTKAEQRERHRISHILHDDLQQRLYAIQMQMTFWSDGFLIADEGVRMELASIKEQLDEVLAVTRHLSVDLSPPILHDEGLSHAIRWLSAQMQEQHGLKIHLQAEESFAIPNEELQVLLFNCVRELLFNIVKHAGVKEANVGLQWSDGNLQIEVQDQGNGFHTQMPVPLTGDKSNRDEYQKPSFGLPTMRHQLSLFGGQMHIKSQPGAGTHVTLRIPVYENGLKTTEQAESPSI